MEPAESSFEAIAIGGGPAGLTAAIELAKHGRRALVLEGSDHLGGISRTVSREGWRFDIGGHRFFTKVPRVEKFWHDTLPERDFLIRSRLSRIFYRGKFFDYPLRATNAIRNLGPWEALLCVASYLKSQLFPPRDQSTFEGWVAARFGWRLYLKFFKTYTEKVWGVPARDIPADWAAQRIKNLSLGKAILNAMFGRARRTNKVTSLIERFYYPRLGPGMMWEACAQRAIELGQEIRLGSHVTAIRRTDAGDLGVATSEGEEFLARHVISSMPLSQLVFSLQPAVPGHVQEAASKLRYRDFLTVALVVADGSAFPDNWIYIHAPEVRVGRIQNFGSWSPEMVAPGTTCLGLEYFVNVGDDLWSLEDSDLIKLASQELDALRLARGGSVERGFVVRVEKAYPVYDTHHSAAVGTIRAFLAEAWPEIHPVGRNGMHRYNNQDHSMLTAMVTVDNIVFETDEDPWAVNLDPDYHESTADGSKVTGRSAPTVMGH